MRSGTPASRAASAGRSVRSRTKTLPKRCQRKQRHELEQIDRTFELGAVVLEIDRLGNPWIGGEQFLGATRRRREKGDLAARRVAAAIAWMKGRCQMTSPMPRFTWMTATLALVPIFVPIFVLWVTAFADTLIAAPKVAISGL